MFRKNWYTALSNAKMDLKKEEERQDDTAKIAEIIKRIEYINSKIEKLG